MEPERPRTVLSDWRQHDGGACHDTAVVLGGPANPALQGYLPHEHVSIDEHHLRRHARRTAVLDDQGSGYFTDADQRRRELVRGTEATRTDQSRTLKRARYR